MRDPDPPAPLPGESEEEWHSRIKTWVSAKTPEESLAWAVGLRQRVEVHTSERERLHEVIHRELGQLSPGTTPNSGIHGRVIIGLRFALVAGLYLTVGSLVVTSLSFLDMPVVSGLVAVAWGLVGAHAFGQWIEERLTGPL